MDPRKYPALREALSEIRTAIYLAEGGLALLDPDEPMGLEFILNGLRLHLAQAEEQMEIADSAAIAIAHRLSDRDATQALVRHLVRDGRHHEIAEVDMAALVRAYEAESAQAEENTTCGIVLDRALRRMKTAAGS
jgi:hypothetical protein